MITPNETASLLIQALPYIRRFTGKIVVLKVGGLPMTDPERARSLAKDVLLLHSVGIRPVLVHGGGPQIDELMGRLGMIPQFRDGLRVTDGETLDIVRMVLVGKINRELVNALNALEPVAVGVAGEDGRLLTAAPIDPALGFVGKVGAVRAGLLTLCSTTGWCRSCRRSDRTQRASRITSTPTMPRARSRWRWGPRNWSI